MMNWEGRRTGLFKDIILEIPGQITENAKISQSLGRDSNPGLFEINFLYHIPTDSI